MMLRNGWVAGRDGTMTSPHGEMYATWAAAYLHILAGWESEDDILLFPSLAELRAMPVAAVADAPLGRPRTRSASAAIALDTTYILRVD
jgi:hypothetical protein